MKSIFLSYYSRYDSLIWIRLVGELLTGLSGSMLAPFLILYLHQKIGGSILLPLMIVAMQPLTDLVVTFIAGGWADKFGRKPIIMMALSLQLIAMTGFIFAGSVIVFGLLYVLNGIGRSFYIPAERAQIADAVVENQRSEVFALLSTIGYTTMAIGPLVGIILFRHNPASLFGLDALAIGIYLFLFWLKVPETTPMITDKDERINQQFAEKKSSSFFSQYKLVLGLMACMLPISLFYAQTESVFPLYAQDKFENYLVILSRLATAQALTAVTLQIWLVKKTESWSMSKIVLVSYCSYTIAALGYGYSSGLSLFLVAQLLFTIGQSIALSHLLKFVSILAPTNQRSRYFSLFGIHWDISRTIGPVIGGIFFQQFGGPALFSFIAGLLLAGLYAQYKMIQHVENSFRGNLKASA